MCFTLSDIGLNLLIIRDYQHTTEKKALINTGLFIKLCLIGINTIVAIACCFIIEPQLITPFIIFIIMNIIDSLKQYNVTIARAHLNQELEAISFIIETVLTSTLGMVLILIFNTITGLAWAYLIGSLTAFIYINTKTIHHIIPFNTFDKKLMINVIKQMTPFILSSFLFIGLTSVDTLMIKWMNGATGLGYYQSGLKLTETLLIIPSLFSISFYPLISKVYMDTPRIRTITQKSTELMQLISFPIISGSIIFAEPILTFVFSTSFLEGAIAFKYLLIVALITFFNIIFQQILLASQHEKKTVTVNCFAFLINILLNLMLIPKYGIVGAAIGSIVGRGFSFFLLVHLLVTHIKIQPFLFNQTAKYACFTIIMIGSIIMTQNYIKNASLLIFIGAITYLSLLIISKNTMLRKIKTIFYKN